MKSYLVLGLKDDLVNVFNSLGLLYMAQEDFDASEEYFQSALHESQQQGYTYGLKKANFHLGLLHIKKHNLPKAKAFLYKALAIDEKNDDKYGLSLAKNKLAFIAAKENDFDQATKLAEDALQDAKAITASQLVIEAMETLALINKEQKKFEEVIKWQEALIKQQQETSAREKSFGLSFLEILEEKQQAQLASKKQALQAEQKTKEIFQVLEVAGLASIILLILAYLWYKNYAKAVKYSRELAAKNDVIEKNAHILDALNKSIIKQNISLEEANTMKGKLFSIISHDLRGPIASVKGVLDLIGRKPMSEAEIKRILAMLGHEVDVVMGMLNNLLAWSKAQLQGSVVALEPIEVHQLTGENIDFAAREAKQKEISLINEIPENMILMADKERLNFVLRNLLMNAIKFTYQGGSVRVHMQEGDDSVALVVTDNGKGIAPDNIPKLFTDKRFTTAGTAKEKGTGLGLVFSKDFVESLGGSIRVESIEGEGSSFFICLPKLVLDTVGEASVVF
ncbi:hypothetical protein GCM10028895_46360 [Pontibacter rugosus]